MKMYYTLIFNYYILLHFVLISKPLNYQLCPCKLTTYQNIDGNEYECKKCMLLNGEDLTSYNISTYLITTITECTYYVY